MKQTNEINITEIRTRLEQSGGDTYWRSLDELAETDEFKEFLLKEFPQGAEPLEGSVDRRSFMKLLGASLALGGLTSCVRPPEPHQRIVPYVRAPEEIIPGRSLTFASAVTRGGYAHGVLATSHMGRPTKLEGNPDHPASLGATDHVTQAEILSLYDPDRSQNIFQRDTLRAWEEFAAAIAEALEGTNGGQGVRILTETVTSPTLAAQIQATLDAFPEAQWHQYDVAHADNAVAGAELAFGQPVTARYDLSEADVILSLGSDFLGSGPAKLAHSRAFSRARRVRRTEDEMNRLYVLESALSLTGGIADHRVPLRPSEMEAAARQLAAAFGLGGGGGTEVLPPEFVSALAEDLQASGQNAVVLVGDEQPAVVHAIAHAINGALGNTGTTVTYAAPAEANAVDHVESLAELVADMRAGNVSVLVMLGGNPVYNAPVDLEFGAALAAVETSVHLSLYRDETSVLSTWHVPMAHDLESWADVRAFDGSISIAQPLIAPMYGGRSPLEVLSALQGDPFRTAYDIIRGAYQEQAEGDFEEFWRAALYRGVLPGTAGESIDVSAGNGFLGADANEPTTGYEVEFRTDHNVWYGRYANNAWLMESPRPFTKLTWDNPALISPRTAEELNVSTRDLITVTVDGRSLELPVFVQPGHADGVITLLLGFGRTHAGSVGNGVGFDTFALRTSANPHWAPGATVATATGRYALMSTQLHHTMEQRRAYYLLRSNTLQGFRNRPDFVPAVQAYLHESNLYPEYRYDSYQWGMVIDQNVCTGCTACVVACQAENNIPVVGKQQVGVGRNMLWLRIDTYYKGSLDNPEVFHQPMLCMHCEQAPCEYVCPVYATVHDHEGLNVMVYNRCVGTRYCSNNCPYKVRRFNYLQYAELEENALSMAMNPNVTVRSRGVMEKCTYCIQRINLARIDAENESRRIQDGEIVTACQAACPTEAIVFGDISDPDSRVRQDKSSILNYGLLEELNTQPRTSYLARLKNPNPTLALAVAETYMEAGGVDGDSA